MVLPVISLQEKLSAIKQLYKNYKYLKMKITFCVLIMFLLFKCNLQAQQNLFRGNNNYVTPPVPNPSGPIVTNGLVLNLDASVASSYSGSGTTWSDISGSSNNATLVGNPIYTSTAPANFTFSGSNNANFNFVWPAQFTCSLWIYPIGAPGGNFSRILSTGSGDNLEIAINGSNQISYHSPSVSWQSYVTSITSNAWNQLVVVKSANSITFYINGVSTYTASLTSFTSGSKIYFGQRHTLNEGANFRLGAALIYNYALTASDITTNWNAQKVKYGY
jgi:hypothetical protein